YEGYQQNGRNDPHDEQPVAAGRGLHFRGMLLQHREVLGVRFPEYIRGVPEKWHNPDEHVDADVKKHAELDNPRNPHLMRLHDDGAPNDRSGHVADPRHKADDRIPAESKIRTRNAKGLVEEAHELTKGFQAARVLSGTGQTHALISSQLRVIQRSDRDR